MKPVVSVLMSVYNGEKFLREAIDSVLGQTFVNFEFLITDDASTDGSLKMLESYTDSRIRLFRNQKNLGLTVSLNLMLENAKGDFIARLDCDDISMPDRFARQIYEMQQNERLILLAANCLFINENSELINRGEPFFPAADDYGDTFLRWLMLFPENPIIHSSVMLRTILIREACLKYDEHLKYAQDIELWGRLANYGEFKATKDPLVKLRIVNNSITSRKNALQVASGKECARLRQQQLLQKPISCMLEDDPRFLGQLFNAWQRLNVKDNEFAMAKRDLCGKLVKILVRKFLFDPSVLVRLLQTIKKLPCLRFADWVAATTQLITRKTQYWVGEKRKVS